MDATTDWVDTIWRRGGRPDAEISVSAWADRHRMLSQRASAEPGRWRTDRTPYLREIMDSLSSTSPLERVVFMKGAQIGGTEAGNNWLGYIIAEAPGPVMAVWPTVELAKRASRQRVEPMIAETATLAALVAPARSRDSGNTVLSKDFPGGTLIMTGANSAVGLRSMPARYLFLDEVDAYPPDADGEGDPVGLAIARTATFARRKVLMVSTPTVAGLSRIETAFGESDQRRYFVPCPDCGAYQVLAWPQVKWTDLGLPPDQARYVCTHCGAVIPNSKKPAMLAAGEWRPTKEGDERTRGYHLSALYSPWLSWGEVAAAFVAAGKNPSRVKVFVNTMLGETFAESGDAPDWRRLFDRSEDYTQGVVPRGGLALTAGADVQKDRIEVEIVAWGRNRVSWSVDYRLLLGDPQQEGVWQAMTALLNEGFRHELGGTLAITRLAIDTGGHATDAVYRWAGRFPDRVMAIKGVDKATVTVGAPTLVEVSRAGRKLKRGARLWPIGVSLLKSQLYGMLAMDPPTDETGDFPEGYCHFPRYHEEFFKQLTAERLVRRTTRAGYPRLEWELARDRNEALDCRVYAMAAAIASRIDRYGEADWSSAEDALGTLTKPTALIKRAPTWIKSKWVSGD